MGASLDIDNFAQAVANAYNIPQWKFRGDYGSWDNFREYVDNLHGFVAGYMRFNYVVICPDDIISFD